MEGGEELSEAQEPDSGLKEPCKVEESFRLCRGLYVNPPCPVRKQQVDLSVAQLQKLTFNCQYIDL